MDKSGIGITDDLISGLGFTRSDVLSSGGINTWHRELIVDDWYDAGQFKFKSSTYLWVYDDNGFFTAYVSRTCSSPAYSREIRDGAQIAVIKDLDHLKDIIRVLLVDWRTAKEGN